ncbi:MAG: hypothetical protein AAB525_02220 [Patescibacteria group bacterium]
MSILIVFEGIDGVGKTTLAKLTAEKLGAVYYKTPPEPYNSRRAIADELPPDLRFSFYLESMFYTSREVEQLLEQGKSVVADRWIWSTLAYHFALDKNIQKRWFGFDWPICKPDLSLLIFLQDRTCWLERLRSRNQISSSSDLWLEEKIDLLEQINNLFRQINPNFILFDSSGTAEDNVKKIITIIDQNISR